jgi:hypothetical protein
MFPGEDAEVVALRRIAFAQRQAATLAIQDRTPDRARQRLLQRCFQIAQDRGPVGVDGIIPTAQQPPAEPLRINCLVPGMVRPSSSRARRGCRPWSKGA